MLPNPPQMHLKLLQKEQFKNQQRKLVIWLVIKVLTKSQKSQKFHHRMVEYETENIGFDWDIPKERYITQKKRQKIVDDLRFIKKYNNGISKHNNK